MQGRNHFEFIIHNVFGKDEFIVKNAELVLLDHVKEGELLVGNGFLVGEFVFFLASSNKALDGGIEVRLSFDKLFHVNVLECQYVIDPKD